MEALASQAGPLEVAALSKPAQQSLQQQQLLQVARQGPQRDAATRRAEATRFVASLLSLPCLSPKRVRALAYSCAIDVLRHKQVHF